jgi:hypothetical protein
MGIGVRKAQRTERQIAQLAQAIIGRRLAVPYLFQERAQA